MNQITLVREASAPYLPKLPYASEKRTYSLLDDWWFKKVIASDEKTLAKYLSQWHYCKIDSLRILPQEPGIDLAFQKAIRFDVHGIINGKILFVIEAQRQGSYARVLKRMEYYAARLLAAQKMRGKEYEQLESIWLILVADFPFFPKPRIVADDIETRFKTSQIPLTATIHMSIMESGRTGFLMEKPVKELDGLERWAILFGNSGNPEKQEWIRRICEQDEEIREVVKKMSELSKTYEEYIRETMEVMKEMDLADVREIEFNRGKVEGALCALVELILKNARNGIPAEMIAKFLGKEENIIQQILGCHDEHPEWSIEQIAERIKYYA